MQRALYIVLLSLFMAAMTTASAQQNDETVYRLELGVGAGAGFTFTDMDGKVGLAGSLLARFPLNPRMAIKTQFSYVQAKGTTVGKKGFYPANPDMSGQDRLAYDLNSGICEVEGLYELHFLPYGYQRDYRGHFRLVPYIQLGLGFSYGMEGKAFTPHFPVGVGLKYKVAQRLNLGLDWQVRFTLSDELDGLKEPLGIKASGFSNKDHYSTLSLTLTYDLNPKCPTCNKD